MLALTFVMGTWVLDSPNGDSFLTVDRWHGQQACNCNTMQCDNKSSCLNSENQ